MAGSPTVPTPPARRTTGCAEGDGQPAPARAARVRRNRTAPDSRPHAALPRRTTVGVRGRVPRRYSTALSDLADSKAELDESHEHIAAVVEAMESFVDSGRSRLEHALWHRPKLTMSVAVLAGTLLSLALLHEGGQAASLTRSVVVFAAVLLAGMLARTAWQMESPSETPWVLNVGLLLWLAAAVSAAADAAQHPTSAWPLDMADTPTCMACGLAFQCLAAAAVFIPAALELRSQGSSRSRVVPKLWASAVAAVRRRPTVASVAAAAAVSSTAPAIVPKIVVVEESSHEAEEDDDDDDDDDDENDCDDDFTAIAADSCDTIDTVGSFAGKLSPEDITEPPLLGKAYHTGGSVFVIAVDELLADQARFAVKSWPMAAVTLLLLPAVMATPAKLLRVPSPAPLFYAMLLLAAVLCAADRLRDKVNSRSRCVAHGICLTAAAIWLGSALSPGLLAVFATRAATSTNVVPLVIYSVYLVCMRTLVDALAHSFFRSKQLAEKYSFFAKLYCDLYFSLAFLGSSATDINFDLPAILAINVAKNAVQATPLGDTLWLLLRERVRTGQCVSSHKLLEELARQWTTVEHENMSKLITALVLPVVLFFDPLLPGSRLLTATLSDEQLAGEQLVFGCLLLLQLGLYWLNSRATRWYAERLLADVTNGSEAPCLPPLFAFGLPAVVEADDKHWALHVRPLICGLLFVVVDTVSSVTVVDL